MDITKRRLLLNAFLCLNSVFALYCGCAIEALKITNETAFMNVLKNYMLLKN